MEFKIGGEELAKVLTYYGLISSTAEDKIICPFHKDVNPSMKLDFNKGVYYCFGCGESGDAMSFVKKMNPKMSDLRACREYVRILRSKKTKHVKITRHSRQYEKCTEENLDIAKDYYYGLKKIDWETDKSEEVQEVLKYMQDRGFTAKALTKIGAKVTYNKAYPIIFPLMDNKEFVGWDCRTTTKAIEKKRKYLYNEGFSRATTVCGVYGKYDYVYLVEGYMDYLKFRQFGIHNVVTVLGWKLTDLQIKKLKDNGIKTIISALDNDSCGIKGTQYLTEYFTVYRFRYLKGIKDPGEMTKPLFIKMNNKTLEDMHNGRAYNEQYSKTKR